MINHYIKYQYTNIAAEGESTTYLASINATHRNWKYHCGTRGSVAGSIGGGTN